MYWWYFIGYIRLEKQIRKDEIVHVVMLFNISVMVSLVTDIASDGRWDKK